MVRDIHVGGAQSTVGGQIKFELKKSITNMVKPSAVRTRLNTANKCGRKFRQWSQRESPQLLAKRSYRFFAPAPNLNNGPNDLCLKLLLFSGIYIFYSMLKLIFHNKQDTITTISAGSSRFTWSACSLVAGCRPVWLLGIASVSWPRSRFLAEVEFFKWPTIREQKLYRKQSPSK